jgi:predicted DNA-binding protein
MPHVGQTQIATVRFTIDMSESLHRKLSMLAARTGRKKVDIVRVLLEEALKNVEG